MNGKVGIDDIIILMFWCRERERERERIGYACGFFMGGCTFGG